MSGRVAVRYRHRQQPECWRGFGRRHVHHLGFHVICPVDGLVLFRREPFPVCTSDQRGEFRPGLLDRVTRPRQLGRQGFYHSRRGATRYQHGFFAHPGFFCTAISPTIAFLQRFLCRARRCCGASMITAQAWDGPARRLRALTQLTQGRSVGRQERTKTVFAASPFLRLLSKAPKVLSMRYENGKRFSD
jgi:hypothetical protein